MRSAVRLALAVSAATLVAGCAAGGPFGRGRGPDEFAVARNAPLAVPPDFALTPPRPGEADVGTQDPRAQALQALFGGPQPRSAVENNLLQVAHAERRRARRPLGRRRSADRGGEPRHAGPDHAGAAPGRRPGSLGFRSQLTAALALR